MLVFQQIAGGERLQGESRQGLGQNSLPRSAPKIGYFIVLGAICAGDCDTIRCAWIDRQKRRYRPAAHGINVVDELPHPSHGEVGDEQAQFSGSFSIPSMIRTSLIGLTLRCLISVFEGFKRWIGQHRESRGANVRVCQSFPESVFGYRSSRSTGCSRPTSACNSARSRRLLDH
jgi:hypothetical protein